MSTVRDLVDCLLAYADNKATIAELRAKHQNAPGYLHDQSANLIEQAVQMSSELDTKLQALEEPK